MKAQKDKKPKQAPSSSPSSSANTDTPLTLDPSKIPIVYHPSYNISFFSIERLLHAFDTHKYAKVFSALQREYAFQHYQPTHEVTEQDLQLVHTKQYLSSLSSSSVVGRIAEVHVLAMFPNWLLQRKMLSPMRYAVQGTIVAANLALEYGWAINLGGGFHHAKVNQGEGFCVYADIPLAIRKLQQEQRITKALIVDLDAHQGNGLPTIHCVPSPEEDDKTAYIRHDDNVDIFDMYNKDNYPRDFEAKKLITYCYPLPYNTKDDKYLEILQEELPKALDATKPNIVFYNAGTDIYENDPLGALKVTKEGIITRDEVVFNLCKQRNIPIVMVLSGGYTLQSAEIITTSLKNLHNKQLIHLQAKSTSD